MRTITPAAQAKLNQKCGAESLIIVEIQWVPGGQVYTYADRAITPLIEGRIVSLTSIDSAVTADGSRDSTQVHLVLDDADGTIKELCDRHSLVKRPVSFYQWFDGLQLSDKFLLFKGEINSPFVWDEGGRTVEFDVITRVEDVEVGFSLEEGDFPAIPPDALGKAWPLVFGTVCDVEAVQVRSPRYGILQSGEGIHDYTLESRICQARYIQCADVPSGLVSNPNLVTQYFPPTLYQDNQGVIHARQPDQTGAQLQYHMPDPSCVENVWFTICSLLDQLKQQRAYEHPTITVLGASTLFPQGQRITLNIEGGKFTGTFSGDVFTIQSREHPDYATHPPGTCRPVGDRAYRVDNLVLGGDWTRTRTGTAWYNQSLVEGSRGGTNANPQTFTNFCDKQAKSSPGLRAVGGPAGSQQAFDNMPTASFFWARAGSKVFLEAEAEVLYIVNLLPCTITRVAAMKQTNFGPKLVTVPPEWYTIYETDYDGYTVTEIGMSMPLSQRSEIVTLPDGSKRVTPSKWSDQLYVTLTSSIGPNPVDIIAWLIQKYTSLNVDEASFNHVRNRLANYPASFALLERKNVMEVVADIATQSRCVVYVRGDTVYLKYASEEPTPAATITASDVLANSLRVMLSPSDEVATKHVIRWSRGRSEGDLKIILKHNVAKYGTREIEHNYYTHNIYENVLKSATFWAIRLANVWKLVEFSTPLKHLALEVFDCVLLDLPDVSPSPVKAIITAVNYDVENEQITFTCWTPIKAGETEPYIHAWPADIPAQTLFPTPREREEGLGYNFQVAPPPGHLLYQPRVADGNPPTVLTSGDPYPSDIGDTLGTCLCPDTADGYVDEPDPVFVALKRAEKAVRDAQDAKQEARITVKKNKSNNPPANDPHYEDTEEPGDQDKREPPPADDEPVDGCQYAVKIVFLRVDMVSTQGCGEPLQWSTTPGVLGCVIGSTVTHELRMNFTGMASANQAAAATRQLMASMSGQRCGYACTYARVGDWVPIQVDGPTSMGTSGCQPPPGNPETEIQTLATEPQIK